LSDLTEEVCSLGGPPLLGGLAFTLEAPFATLLDILDDDDRMALFDGCLPTTLSTDNRPLFTLPTLGEGLSILEPEVGLIERLDGLPRALLEDFDVDVLSDVLGVGGLACTLCGVTDGEADFLGCAWVRTEEPRAREAAWVEGGRELGELSTGKPGDIGAANSRPFGVR